MNGRKLVSVLMLTYNHADFVGQAIGSALAQVDTELEVIVADDASTDGTLDEVECAAAGDPRVRILPTPHNLGMQANFRRAWAACRGRYIAILEGDDYWLDPSKLSRQSTAMEQAPRLTLSAHTAVEVDEAGTHGETFPADPTAVSRNALLRLNQFHTCTVMYRAGVVPAIPRWFDGLPMADWPLHVMHAVRGDLMFLPHTWAAYRVHSAGAWSPQDYWAKMERTLDVNAALRKNVRMDRDDRRLLKSSASDMHLALARERRLSDTRDAWSHLGRSICLIPGLRGHARPRAKAVGEFLRRDGGTKA